MSCLCRGFIHPSHKVGGPAGPSPESNVVMTPRGLVEVPEVPALLRRYQESLPCPKCRSFAADRRRGAFVTVSWAADSLVHQHAVVPSGALYRLSIETAIEAGRRLAGDYRKRVTLRSRRRARRYRFQNGGSPAHAVE